MHALSRRPATHVVSQDFGRDVVFVSLLDAYRPSGGIARAEDLALRWRDRDPGSAWLLARWIARGDALHFAWEHEHWLPLFQFYASSPLLREGMAPVLDELKAVLDPWELARWFATPNAWLRERRPADLMARQWEQVREAARADRFVLAG